MGLTVLFTFLYALVFILMYYSTLKTETRTVELGKKISINNYLPYAIGLFVLFLIQMFIAGKYAGHKQDSGLFRMWTAWGNSHKVSEYYTTGSYVDYPPVYLYILFVLGKIAAFLGVKTDSLAYFRFIKFVPILCDMITTGFIFKLAAKHLGDRKAFSLACLTAINPANIINSTIWGQADSFVTLILVLMLFCLYDKKYLAGLSLFALSFLTKPQMIIYAPLVGFVTLFDLFDAIKQKESGPFIKKLLLGIVGFVLVLLIVPLPICNGNYSLVIKNFTNAMGLYPYATLNASNLYAAFGANWIKNNEIFVLFSYKTWGFIFIVLTSLAVGAGAYFAKDRKKVFFLSAFTTAAIYMLAHTMHERYLFALLLVLLITYILTEDKRLIILYAVFSLTLFITCSEVLVTNLADDFILARNNKAIYALFLMVSWINVAAFIFMIKTFYDILIKGDIKAMSLNKAMTKSTAKSAAKASSNHKKQGYSYSNSKTQSSKNAPLFSTQRLRQIQIMNSRAFEKLTKIDIIIMVVITLFYGITAFWNIGSSNTPTTYWLAKQKGDYFIIDLGKTEQLKDLRLRTGWIDRRDTDRDVKRDLKIEVSADGSSYAPLADLTGTGTNFQVNNVFKWADLKCDKAARYVKVTVDDGRFEITEMAFFGGSKEQRYLPVSASSNLGAEEAAKLIDEQDKVDYEISWENGTYFDEIYHPRTAYEMIQHKYPYENTHPPLGKFIISLGIRMFGMTPFGWRFFGVLCGVLMTPVAYLFGKRLFKNYFAAAATCLIFSFDFMHLSQTRLATIDSYTTFFIMLAYYFMYKYINQSFYDTDFKKFIKPLALSGIFWGLSCATKWQGIYGGAGLAVMFFVHYAKRFMEYNAAKVSAKTDEQMKHIRNNYNSLSVKTFWYAVLFFVGVPFVIYFLAYIPAMWSDSTGLKFFFTNQSSMYNYHSNLVSNHPYSSPWYKWVIDQKPLYAYSPNRQFVPQGTQMGITTFGNPLIWWLTIPSVLGIIITAIRKKGNNETLTILCGFGSMYLPWVLIPREAFIYHFFPCVIFVVLSIVYFINMYVQGKKSRMAVASVYILAVIVVYFMFYPVLTGMQVPSDYVNHLRWMKDWVIG